MIFKDSFFFSIHTTNWTPLMFGLYDVWMHVFHRVSPSTNLLPAAVWDFTLPAPHTHSAGVQSRASRWICAIRTCSMSNSFKWLGTSLFHFLGNLIRAMLPYKNMEVRIVDMWEGDLSSLWTLVLVSVSVGVHIVVAELCFLFRLFFCGVYNCWADPWL